MQWRYISQITGKSSAKNSFTKKRKISPISSKGQFQGGLKAFTIELTLIKIKEPQRSPFIKIGSEKDYYWCQVNPKM